MSPDVAKCFGWSKSSPVANHWFKLISLYQNSRGYFEKVPFLKRGCIFKFFMLPILGTLIYWSGTLYILSFPNGNLFSYESKLTYNEVDKSWEICLHLPNLFYNKTRIRTVSSTPVQEVFYKVKFKGISKFYSISKSITIISDQPNFNHSLDI